MAKKKEKNKPTRNKLGNHYGGADGVAGTPDDARRADSKYYLLRDRFTVGRKRKYETAKDLFDVAMDYFAAVDANPMKETRVFGSGVQVDVDLQIPYTLSGFQLFAGIDDKLLKRYKEYAELADATEQELDLAYAAEQIELIIHTQKLEGATCGKFNHQMVALQLGLSSKVKNENITFDSAKMTADEIKKFNSEIEDKY